MEQSVPGRGEPAAAEQVWGNPDRFPPEFMFQSTPHEFSIVFEVVRKLTNASSEDPMIRRNANPWHVKELPGHEDFHKND